MFGKSARLMDEVADPGLVADLRRIISEQAEGALEAHDVRTRTEGAMTFIEFHLVVPGRMPVKEAHAICDRVEQAMLNRVGAAAINIHVEPEQKAKHQACWLYLKQRGASAREHAPRRGV